MGYDQIWAALIPFKSGKLNSICTTQVLISIIACLHRLQYHIFSFSFTSAVKFFVRENQTFLVFTISIEGRSDGPREWECLMSDPEPSHCLWSWREMAVDITWLYHSGKRARWITLRQRILPVAGSRLRHVIVRIPRVM